MLNLYDVVAVKKLFEYNNWLMEQKTFFEFLCIFHTWLHFRHVLWLC